MLIHRRGPYPSVWAMLILHHHPDNKNRAPPKLLFSHQTLYKERTNVDLNSRWLLEWDGVGQALCTTDMAANGNQDATVTITCEEADVCLECEPRSILTLVRTCADRV